MKYSKWAVAATLAVSLPALGATAAMAAPATPAASTAVAAASPVDLASARATILSETNAARAAAGLPAVTTDGDLDAVAQACSEFQAANGAMAHCSDFASAYPAGWTRASENVASGQSVADVVDAWLASPGHRANILDPEATHLGIGYALGADGRTYFTQNFAAYPAGSRPGEPAPTEPAPAPEPAPAAPVVDVPVVNVPTAAEIRDLVWQQLRDSGYPWVDGDALRQQIQERLAAAGIPSAGDVTALVP